MKEKNILVQRVQVRKDNEIETHKRTFPPIWRIALEQNEIQIYVQLTWLVYST